MTSPQPAPGPNAARQLASSKNKALALHLQQQQALAAAVDPHAHWQQLLVQEQALQRLEAAMCVCNIRWSADAWQLLHDRSEQLSRDMAACIELMGGCI